MLAVLDNPHGVLKYQTQTIHPPIFSSADHKLHSWACQCNPEVLHCHPSDAWCKLAPLRRYQSPVRALRPSLCSIQNCLMSADAGDSQTDGWAARRLLLSCTQSHINNRELIIRPCRLINHQSQVQIKSNMIMQEEFKDFFFCVVTYDWYMTSIT